ncbi:MAG TPA: hypothetical protein VFF67_01620 [Thermoplasmata archaeon]|nr:hypothetical protein [Thermoplasmata archaeon]
MVIDRTLGARLIAEPGHFASLPAIPTTRAPASFASWQAIEPTPPAAPEITNVSPGCGRAISRAPKYAASPEMPSVPTAQFGGIPSGTRKAGANPLPSVSVKSSQPK